MAVDLATPLQTYLTTAAAALAAGDWSTALSNAYAAQAIAAAMPANISRTQGTGGGTASIGSDADRIDKLIRRILQAQAAAQGVVINNVEYAAVQDVGGSAGEIGVFPAG